MHQVPPIVVLSMCVMLAGGAAVPTTAEAGTQQEAPPRRVLLRFAADSGVVGSYKFTTNETHHLSYDIAPDDPRAELLSPSTGPRQWKTELVLTMVTGTQTSDEERRYIIYWLGYRVSGDDVQTLTALQWDSIFQKAGRRAVLKMTPLGLPQGIEVSSDAVRPVGQALASILGGMATDLPADSVAVGDSWSGRVAIPVRRPDGTRVRATVEVTYRLAKFVNGPEGETAHIEFDGEPIEMDGEVDFFSGRYFGEGVFAVHEGRYERMIAAGKLDVAWAIKGDLPPSRSQVDWQGEFNRS